MHLKRLYTNMPGVFSPIQFNQGFNVVLAEIRIPANRELDTHNLGKSTIGDLLDFCLLKKKSKGFFLFREDSFLEFVFYLEIVVEGVGFVTIARAVDPGSKVSIMRSSTTVLDCRDSPADDWDHIGLSFDRAKLVLDGLLDFGTLRPWNYRKLIGYLLRTQQDYLDVFQLSKFSGPHQDWKPFVARLLGMNSDSVNELYETRGVLEEKKKFLSALVREWGPDDTDPSTLDGLISVRRREVEDFSRTLQSFDFGPQDERRNAELVEDVEQQISSLNEERYYLSQLLSRIDESIDDDKVIFRTADAERLFREAGIFLGDQMKRTYDQLISFNRAISNERRLALEIQAAEARIRTASIEAELRSLNDRRATLLSFLRESESIGKYKDLTIQLAQAEGRLNQLESMRESATRLIEMRQETRSLDEQFGQLQTQVEAEVYELSREEESDFGKLRRYFSEIVRHVLGQDAILAIRVNSQGGVDFAAEFVGEAGIATSGDRGTSYKKLLCIAFDLAMLRAHGDVNFARFSYHDGALEQIEPRKRVKLIEVFRQYSQYGLQPMISVLDSDLPEPVDSSAEAVHFSDVVVSLHDEGEHGRLFRMASW